MEEQGKINKDTVTKFKAMDKILENIDGKVTEVGSSNLQVLNTMKMLETQVAQLAGRLSSNEGKLPGGRASCLGFALADVGTLQGIPRRSSGARIIKIKVGPRL